MESTIRQTNSIKFELDVALTPAELTPYLDSAYREAQKHASLKGFRKGKVPIGMIKKLYGQSLEREAYEEAVQQEFARAMQTQDVQPVGSPAITKLDRTDDGGLSFTVAYETLPKVELTDYKGLPARKVFHVITDEEFEAEMARIRESNATQEDEPAESVADENHIVKVNLQKLEAGVVVEENVMSDMPVYLARHDVNPELKAMLLNTKVGDTFRIDLPTGEDATMINYEVTVREIHRMALPELDDAFAAQLMGREDATVADLQDAVRQGIMGEYERRFSGFFRDELINALIERHPFDVPDVFVAEVMKSFVDDMRRGPKKELPKDFDGERFVREMRPTAERTAKWAILRDLIIEKEGLTPEESDYEGLADIEAQRTGIDYDTLIGYFKKSDKIRDRIVAEKAVQLLEDYAVVTEVEDRTMPQMTAPDHIGHDHSDHDHADHDHADHDHSDHDHADHDHAGHDHA